MCILVWRLPEMQRVRGGGGLNISVFTICIISLLSQSMCQNLSIIIATPPQSDQPQPDIPFTQTLRVLSLSMLGECYGSECIQKCWIIFSPLRLLSSEV